MLSFRSSPPVAVLSILVLTVACEEAGFPEEPQVRINELRSRDGDPIELLNLGDSPVALGGWALQDGGGAHWTLPEGTVLQPGAFLVSWQDHDHPLSLGSSDSLTLLNGEGAVHDRVAWAEQGALPSLCRLDEEEAPRTCSRATLGGPNHEDPITDVLPLWIADSAGSEPLEEVNELGFDADGKLWIGDVGSLQLVIYDPQGNFLGTTGSEDFTRAEDGGKEGPEAIRLGPDEDIYAVDRAGRRVLVYDSTSWALLRTIELPEMLDPTGLAIDSLGNLFLADQATGEVHEYSFDGTWLGSLDEQHVLEKTETLALVEGEDLLLATSEERSRADAFSLESGLFQERSIGAPQERSQPEPGRLRDDIEGIAVDSTTHRLYLSDEYNGRILVHDLSSPGVYEISDNFAALGAFGVLGSQPGMLDSADGLAVESERRLIAVADQGNGRVQVFSLDDVDSALQASSGQP